MPIDTKGRVKRAKKAARVNIRPGTLDKLVIAERKGNASTGLKIDNVEPWPEPVKPAQLLTDISECVRRFIVCEPETSKYCCFMGGYGSGRHSNIDSTDDCRSIDVRKWQRQGLLRTDQSFSCSWSRNGKSNGQINVRLKPEAMWLSYSCRVRDGDWQYLDYAVGLQTTVCHYGGKRYWFSCPAIGCGKRVAVLYIGNKYFACRKCYQLAYSSQRETVEDRAVRNVDKIRDKLEWEPGFLNGHGSKPKGMHWKTFHRLYAEYDKLVNQAMSGYTARFGKI
jgi:hypothetical protein